MTFCHTWNKSSSERQMYDVLSTPSQQFHRDGFWLFHSIPLTCLTLKLMCNLHLHIHQTMYIYFSLEDYVLLSLYQYWAWLWCRSVRLAFSDKIAFNIFLITKISIKGWLLTKIWSTFNTNHKCFIQQRTKNC